MSPRDVFVSWIDKKRGHPGPGLKKTCIKAAIIVIQSGHNNTITVYLGDYSIYKYKK